MNRFLPTAVSLVRLIGFALVWAGAYLALPFISSIPRLVIAWLIAVAVARFSREIGAID
jgi:hypothetical protein